MIAAIQQLYESQHCRFAEWLLRCNSQATQPEDHTHHHLFLYSHVKRVKDGQGEAENDEIKSNACTSLSQTIRGYIDCEPATTCPSPFYRINLEDPYL